jgi:hypothetical protein
MNPHEETIFLPFQASNYIIELMFGVCNQIQKVGSHTLDKVIQNDSMIMCHDTI